MHPGVTAPRMVLRDDYVFITQTCTQRQFLLRPDEETNNIMAYCIGVAATRYGMLLIGAIAESNHEHTLLKDPEGRFPEFLAWYHGQVARTLNARWGRSENLWSSDQVSVVRLVGRRAVIRKLAYLYSNPVKDRLVERAIQWPGFSTYRNFLNGTPLRARRPHRFFSATGALPATIEVPLVIPADLGTREQVVAEVRAAVEEIERRVARYRARSGKRVLGRRAILAQSWRDAPTAPRKKTAIRPRVAGDRDARLKALDLLAWFHAQRRAAWLAWCAGLPATFPPGTYKIARRLVLIPIAA